MTENETARVIKLRPRPRPRPRPDQRPTPDLDPPVSSLAVRPVLKLGPVVVEWEGFGGTYTAVCVQCTDSMTSFRADEAYEWADIHECDSELAGLLSDIAGGSAA